MILGIRGTVRAEGIREILPRLCRMLLELGLDFRLAEELLERGDLSPADLEGLSPEMLRPERRIDREIDVLMTLGGDGSMLAAVQDMRRNIPILGVHMGSMGYLTATTPEDLEDCLRNLAGGRLSEERRMMLKVEALHEGVKFKAHALNDVVLASSVPGRVIRLATRINHESLFNVTGDGLIHSTPTGSTAYNLGGGGPVLEPGMDAIVLTPIMPHSISVRSIVTSADCRIETEVSSHNRQMLLSVDGQLSRILPEGTRVTVARSRRRVRLLKGSQPGFIGVLRNKLMWNLEDR